MQKGMSDVSAMEYARNLAVSRAIENRLREHRSASAIISLLQRENVAWNVDTHSIDEMGLPNRLLIKILTALLKLYPFSRMFQIEFRRMVFVMGVKDRSTH